MCVAFRFFVVMFGVVICSSLARGSDLPVDFPKNWRGQVEKKGPDLIHFYVCSPNITDIQFKNKGAEIEISTGGEATQYVVNTQLNNKDGARNFKIYNRNWTVYADQKKRVRPDIIQLDFHWIDKERKIGEFSSKYLFSRPLRVVPADAWSTVKEKSTLSPEELAACEGS